MSEIISVKTGLPTQISELNNFISVGNERVKAYRAELQAMQKIGAAAELIEETLKSAQDAGELVLDAQVRAGEIILAMPTAQGQRTDLQLMCDGAQKLKTKKELIEEAGFSPKQAITLQALADNKDLVEQAKADARAKDSIVTKESVLRKVKDKKKKAEILEAEQAIAEQVTEEYKPIIYIEDSVGFIPTEKYDLLLTDPPYSTHVDNIKEFVESWLYNALNNVKATGFAYVFIGAYPEELKAYLNAKIPEHIELCQQLIWTYKNTLGNNPNDRYKLNYQVCLFYRGVDAPDLNCPLTEEQWAVQEINAPDGRQGDRYHEWQKPMEIAERFIRHSTEPGMTVFDPFACTGTFLLAAAKLGRKSYGFEINPEHAAIAFERGCVHE